jgi:carbon monoxide dehydrogenase subunit G
VAITIEKKFQVTSSVEDVWSFIANPAQVAACLPGVELTDVVDDVTYTGNVRVKVGPMTVAYAGEARVTERDESIHTFKMVGKGKEQGGAGSAKMELMATVVAVDGGVEIGVKSTLDLTGKVVRFGRGMVEAVSDQLFDEFVANLRAHLETEKVPAPLPSEPLPTAPSLDVSPSEDAPSEASLPAPAPEPPSGALVVSKPPSRLAPAGKPVAALPLFFRALVAMLKRIVLRLFGRSRNRRG